MISHIILPERAKSARTAGAGRFGRSVAPVMIKDRRFALIFRTASLLFALSGLLSMMGVFRGELYPSILMYYTIQSNILAVILLALLTIRTAFGLRWGITGSAGFFARFEMVCVIDTMLTFVVYWVLLAPNLFSMVDGYSLWAFDNLAVHCFTPLICLADYILFTQSRHLKYRDVYTVVIYPLIYVAATSLAGLFGYVYYTSASDGLPVRFPYYFYDFDRIGVDSLYYIGALVVFFLIAAHVFYLFDAKLRKNYWNTDDKGNAE